MNKLTVLLFTALLLVHIPVSGQNARFDSLVFKGIDQIYNIEFDSAEKTFRELIADYPNHPGGRFFLAMIDWWKILLNFSDESHDDLFFEKLEDVIFQCDEILESDPDNVDALFFKGGAIGFRGRLYANRESYLKAADDGREALPIVERVYSIDPDNKDILLGFGIYNYFADVLPQDYPMLEPLFLFYPRGDRKLGLEQLEAAAKGGKYARWEAMYFLMKAYYDWENNIFKAGEYIDILTGRFPNNALFQKYKNRIAVRRGDYVSSFEISKNILEKCASGMYGFDEATEREASYYIAVHHQINNRSDSAITYFSRSDSLSQIIDGDEASGFRIKALLHIGNLYDLTGRREEAITVYKQMLELRDYDDSHADAERYIEKPFGSKP